MYTSEAFSIDFSTGNSFSCCLDSLGFTSGFAGSDLTSVVDGLGGAAGSPPAFAIGMWLSGTGAGGLGWFTIGAAAAGVVDAVVLGAGAEALGEGGALETASGLLFV